jgi:hypothetical protein
MVVELEEERPWAWRRDFLLINPAGTLPVLIRQQDKTDQKIRNLSVLRDLPQIGGHFVSLLRY